MKFVTLKNEYVEYLAKNKILIKSKGIMILIDNEYIFIPITSPKDKHKKIKELDNRFAKIYNKNKLIGVLNIENYVFCGTHSTIYKFKTTDIEHDQIIQIKKLNIEKKINIYTQKIHVFQNRKDLLEYFNNEIGLEIKKKANEKILNTLRMVSNFENIEITNEILTAVNGIPTNKIEQKYEYKILKSAKDCCDTIYCTT